MDDDQISVHWNYYCFLSSRFEDVIDQWAKKLSKVGKANFQRTREHLAQQPKTEWNRPHASPLGNHIYVIRFKDENRTQHRVFGHFYNAKCAFVMTDEIVEAISDELGKVVLTSGKHLIRTEINTPNPTVYVDRVCALALGPFVSKVTLAQENINAGTLIPVLTLTMPTNALHQLARDIDAALSEAGHQKLFTESYEEYQNKIK